MDLINESKDWEAEVEAGFESFRQLLQKFKNDTEEGGDSLNHPNTVKPRMTKEERVLFLNEALEKIETMKKKLNDESYNSGNAHPDKVVHEIFNNC